MTPLLSRLRELGSSVLNFRYLVAGSSVSFLIAFGLAFLLVYQNADIMREQINLDFNQQQLSLAKQAVYQIEGTLGDLELELSRLKRFVEASPGRSPAAKAKAMNESLTRYGAKGLLEVGIIDRWNERCGAPAKDRMILGPPQAEERAGGKHFVTSMVCLELSRGKTKGRLLFARIDVSGLMGAVIGHVRSGKTGYAWAINKKGMFLFHPEEDFIGKSALEARKERKPYISFAQINSIMKGRMRRGEEGTGEYVSGWHGGIEGEMTKLIGFAPVKASALPGASAWSVAVVAPKSEVAGAVHRVFVRHLAAGAAIILGAFVFGLLVLVYQYRMRQKVAKTEAHFHEIERIYERVVAQATDLIYVLDHEMRVVLINQHTVDILAKLVLDRRGGERRGLDADPLQKEFYLGRSFTELLGPEDVSFIKDKMDQVLKSKHSLSYEHAIDIKDRRIRLSTKLVPIRDDLGEIRLILGIGRDITEKFEMDQRIYHTEKLASIGTLASGVAHEINNPLGVILGFTDLLMEKIEPESPEHEDLKIIELQATNAKKIVEKLLGFARVTEGLEDTVDVNLALETVTDIVGNTLMTKKMRLSVDIPGNLPKVRGDSREFQQVIFNLVNNSIAAMGDQGVLDLSAWADDAWVHVSVSDTGPGIPGKIRSQIFDPFFTTKKVGEGTGLGLSLCYGIVKKYGGKISFTSVSKDEQPDKDTGTTFTVSMPVYRAEEAGSGTQGGSS